ncbi:MAG: hypothetical protein AAB263_17755 [Planctomycetota bacterium]
MKFIALFALTCLLCAGEDSSLLALPPAERAAAVQALLAATPVHWNGGRTSLGAVVDALSVNGNRVFLAEGVDDRVEVELNPFQGNWWEAVRLACVAFRLRFDEGEPSFETTDGEGQRLPIGQGSLVLTPDATGAPPMRVHGCLAIIAESEFAATGKVGAVTVRSWMRAEPRIPRDQLACARAQSARIESRSGRIGLVDAVVEDEEAVPMAVWRGDLGAITPRDAELAFNVHMAMVQPWRSKTELTAGVTKKFTCDNREVLVALITDAKVTEWEGNALEERRPVIIMSGPDDLLASAQLHLRQGTTELPQRGGGSRSNDGKVVMYRYLRGTPDGVIEAEIEGRVNVPLSSSDLALSIPLAYDRPLGGEVKADPDIPTRVAWVAGKRSLSQWAEQLSTGGNTVLLEVGIDSAAPIELAAVSGTFWDGVVELCRVSGLSPAIDAATTVAGGPVRLVRPSGKSTSIAACGPLLAVATAHITNVLVRGRSERRLAISISYVVEPHVPPERFGQVSPQWASFAIDQEGGNHPVLTTPPADPTAQDQQLLRMRGGMRIIRGRAVLIHQPSVPRDQHDEPTVVVRLDRTQVQRVEIVGLVQVARTQAWHTNLTAEVGKPIEGLLGSATFELRLLRSPTAIAGSQVGPGMLFRGLSGVQSLTVTAAREEGGALEGGGEPTRVGAPRRNAPWFIWSRVPAEGRIVVDITAQTPQPALSLPLRIQIPVP